MKKILMLVSAILLLLAPLVADIVVKSPNGHENLVLGQHWNIAWTADNVKQKVKIVLLKADGVKFGVIVEGLKPGSSPYDWTIGQTRVGPAPEGNYTIRVITMDGNKQDVSDGTFKIMVAEESPAGPASLTVTSPNGGEEWAKLGGSRSITWTAVNFAGHVDLVLTQDGKTVGTIARKLSAGQGSLPWAVGILQGKRAPSGGGYKVRVVKNYEGLFRPKGAPELADESDGMFSIVDVLKKDSPIKIPDKGLTTPALKTEERTYAPVIRNCHFVLLHDPKAGETPGQVLWQGSSQGLANVGFLFSQHNELPRKQYEVWNSCVRFYTGIGSIGRKVLEAKLIIRRIWRAGSQLGGKDSCRIQSPCLAGVVLLDAAPPCESGEGNPPRDAVPSASGTVVPLGESGDSLAIDVTAYVQDVLQLEHSFFGFLLYASNGQDATGSCGNAQPCCMYNAACYDVSLWIKYRAQ